VQEGQRLGFDLIGVGPARPPETDLDAYRAWLDRGEHGEMAYMARPDHRGEHGEMAYMARPDRVARRADPTLILPGARSVVCVAVNYNPGPPPPARPLHGRVSRYAWGQDYHGWMAERLEALAALIRAEVGGDVRTRAYVDSGPLLERALAVQAGLGFIGKNTCLVHPRLGSWLFLGEILLEAELPPTGPAMPPRCGTCTRCLDACPTGALVAPYRLDARRCLSYLTIELKGSIPPSLRPLLGDRIFGCDTCQEVCPWQRFARPTGVAAFGVSVPERAAPLLTELLSLDEAGFRERFVGTAILRLGRGRLLRNVAVALGNAGDPGAVPALRAALSDPDPLVREHAAWALRRLSE